MKSMRYVVEFLFWLLSEARMVASDTTCIEEHLPYTFNIVGNLTRMGEGFHADTENYCYFPP